MKSCGSLRYRLKGNVLAWKNVRALTLPKAGDNSAAMQAEFVANAGTPIPVSLDAIRVGTVVVDVFAYAPYASAPLLRVARAAAAELRHAEAGWGH